MFIDELKKELNTSITENGAVGYATTGKALLDFNFKVSSYRSKSEKDIVIDFKKVWYENNELALKYLFYARDVRGGLGERRLFRACITSIAEELDERVFDWIKEYGRFDDIFIFEGTKLEESMYAFIKKQLTEDAKNYIDNKPISLLAKWLPSIRTSSKETMERAKRVIKYLGFDQKHYRKMLSDLRGYLDVTEKKCSANEWDKIEYASVPSMANLKYKNAFFKHDEKRRTEYLNSLEKGETKINASTAFPHDIVNKYRHAEIDRTLEEMWKALPDYVNGASSTIVVRDGSGSMTCNVGNSNVSALDVATALAIYFGERCSGQFKDSFITFSDRPKLVSFKGYTYLIDKLQLAYSESEVSNTNVEAVFDLILRTAINNGMGQEEIPNILIISDMEFDSCATTNSARDSWSVSRPDTKLFRVIEQRYNEAGYKLPKMSFWNVNSRTGTIPVVENDLGVALVSGFSPTVAKLVLSNETDPFKVLLKEITSERYNQVTLSKN